MLPRFLRRGPILSAAAIVVALCVAAWIAASAQVDRVWAFMPVPPWSEDPPPHVAFERGGAPLPRDRWEFTPVTQAGAAEVIVVTGRPSAAWRRVASVLGLRTVQQRFVSTGPGVDAPSGRWFECVRDAPEPPAPAAPAAR